MKRRDASLRQLMVGKPRIYRWLPRADTWACQLRMTVGFGKPPEAAYRHFQIQLGEA